MICGARVWSFKRCPAKRTTKAIEVYEHASLVALLPVQNHTYGLIYRTHVVLVIHPPLYRAHEARRVQSHKLVRQRDIYHHRHNTWGMPYSTAQEKRAKPMTPVWSPISRPWHTVGGRCVGRAPRKSCSGESILCISSNRVRVVHLPILAVQS